MTKKHKSGTAKEKKSPETEELKKQLEDQRNKLLRALADFDNYKKRVAADKEQFVKFANQSLITNLLPVSDGFGRAIEAAKSNEEIVKGLNLIKKQFEDALTKYGVKEVEALGQPYNANFHQAMIQKEHDGPEGLVLEEMQKGYTLNGRLIRPAMVIVSKKKGEEKNE